MTSKNFLEGLLPKPKSIQFLERAPFRFATSRPCVAGADQPLIPLLEALSEGLRDHLGQAVEVVGQARGDIVLELGETEPPREESYRIKIDSEGIRIVASTAQGAIQGVNFLLQAFSRAQGQASEAGEIELPACEIEDWPLYAWRGMHLDVARTFFPAAKVKRFIDLLAAHRFNVLHWHLTDDQGWRIESRLYPRLTEIGAWRKESPQIGNRECGDRMPTGGYYTQEEIRDVVRHAKSRGVMVVPEIDIPGHSAAVLAAYPELGNSDIPDYQPEVLTRWGIHPWLLAPKPETFSFIEGILGEVAGLFPSPYVHIGGDEAITDHWKLSPATQSFIQTHGLADEDGLFNYFINFAAGALRRNGKRLIGWDEIAEHAAPKDAIVTVWRNWEAADKALAAGLPVIMAPKTHTYFDYYQAPAEDEPEAIGGFLPLEKVAEFDPRPEGLREDQTHLILGAQGQLWSEYLRGWDQLEYMALPRMCALGEIVWSGPIADYEEFVQRLGSHLAALRLRGFGFRPLSEDLYSAA